MIDKYSWADDYGDTGIESLTFAVISGRTADEVITIYGGAPDASIGDYTFREAFALQGEPRMDTEHSFDSGINFHLQVMEQGGQILALENNGYTGYTPEIARRCSADGSRFFSIHWATNVNPEVCQAVDGQVIAYFETYSGETPYSGEPIPDWIIGQQIDIEHLRSTALVFMEQQANVSFNHDWLKLKLPTYQIPDPDVLLKGVPNARQP